MARSPLLPAVLYLLAVSSSACLNAQTISFAKPTQISAGAPAGDVARAYLAGNFNGDGKTDMISQINNAPNSSTYYLNYKFLSGDGTGNFSLKGAPTSGQPNALLTTLENLAAFPVVADVNGDRKDDIVTLLGACLENGQPCGSGALSVYLSNGNGRFTAGYTHQLPAGTAAGVVGDFNKDGKPDVAVFIYPTDNTSNFTGYLLIFLNQGNGSFAATTYEVPVVGNGVTLLAAPVVGDFMGNGNLDLGLLTSADQGPPFLYTFAGNGKGVFASAEYRYTFDSNANPYFENNVMQAANLNGDGSTDLVVGLEGRSSTANSRVPSLIANPSGGFGWFSAVYLPAFPSTILLSDLNGDGKQDLVFLGTKDNKSATGGIYPGLGNGEFETPNTPINVTGSYPFLPTALAVPLQKGELPSLIISNDRSTIELLVNTTKK